MRLRLAARRARRPSAGPDQPVRLPRTGARRRSPSSRSCPRPRTTSRSSSTGTRSGSTRIRIPGRRRPARQQDRLGRPPDPPADGHRRPEPERAVADPEQGDRDQGPQGAPARARRSRRRRRSCASSGASTSRPAGATRSGATSCTRTRWSRTSGPTTRRATRRPSSTATSTRSCRPSSSGWRPAATRGRRRAVAGASRRDGHAAGRAQSRIAAPPGALDRPADCAAIWRESINDYIGPPEPAARSPTNSARSAACTRHAPRPTRTRFVVAERRPAGRRADRRLRLGGRARPALVPVDAVRAAGGAGPRASAGRSSSAPARPPSGTDRWRPCTDSVQPISNGALRARYGIVPRMPILDLVGLPHRPEAFAGLPSGIVRSPFDEIAAGPPDGRGQRELADAVDALDRELLGFEHPEDHAFLRDRAAARVRSTAGRTGPRRLRLRRRGRPGRPDRRARRGAARARRRPPRRGGPAARRVRRLGCPARPADASPTLLAAGLRIDGFPVLLCWDRPFADFTPLRADLARAPLSASGVASAGRGRSGSPSWPNGAAGGSLGLDVAPPSCLRRSRDARDRLSTPTVARGADRDPGPSSDRRRARTAAEPVGRPRQAPVDGPSSSSTTSRRPTRTARRALRDVDLVVPEGDFVFLVGPSGAGKSTLIKLLIRDEMATQGAVILDGQDLARLPRRQVPGSAARSGSSSRTSSCCRPRRSGRTSRSPSRSPARPGARSGRRSIGCWRSSGSPPRRGSTRTSCRAASSSGRRSPGPSSTTRGSIIADEPTGNLDPLISWEILQLLLRINELGVTVLMATHNAEVVTALRKRVVALEEGRIIRDEVGGGYHRED